MIDFLALIQVAEDAAERADKTAFADMRVLLGLYQAYEAKTLDVLGTLRDPSKVTVIQRTMDLFATLQKDPASAPHLDALLKSLSTSMPVKSEPSTSGVTA